MGIFDPKTDTGIAYEQPVAQTSPVESFSKAFSNAAGALSDAYVRNQKEQGSGGGKKEDNLQMIGFQRGIQRAEALRRDGRQQEADRLEKSVISNALADGFNVSSQEGEAAYRAVTGRDPSFMGMSEQERLTTEIMQTDAYQAAFIGSYANADMAEASDEERMKYALGQVARKENNQIILQNEQIGWTQGKRDAFTSDITDFQTEHLGSLFLLAEQGAMISTEDLDTAEAGWQQVKNDMVSARPEGVTDDQWSDVDSMIKQVDNSFELLRKIGGTENMGAKMAQNLVAGVMSADVDDFSKLAAISLINNPDKLDEYGVTVPTDIKELLESGEVRGFDMNSFGLRTEAELNPDGVDDNGEPRLFPKEVEEQVGSYDPMKALNQSKTISRMTKTADGASIEAQPQYRNDFIRLTTKAFAGINKIGEDGEFTSARSVNEVFDGSVVAGIDRVAKVEPTKALTLFRQGEKALNTQLNVARGALLNSSRDSALSWDDENKKLVINRDFLARTGMDPSVMMDFDRAAEQFYDGDMVRMIEDQGSRMQATEDQTFRQVRGLLRGALFQGAKSEIKILNEQVGTIKALEGKLSVFSSRADALVDQNGTPSQMQGDEGLLATEAVGSTQVRGFELVADDTEFLGEVNRVSSNLGIQPVDLLKAISFETVGTFKPDIKNPGSSATGLIQFIEKTAKGLGTSTAELRNMSRTQQMEYVEKYLEPFKGRLNNLGDIYMAIHWPAGVGKDSSYVMYERGTEEYDRNSNLDMNGDGTITRGEAVARVVNSNKGGAAALGIPDVQTSELPDVPLPSEGPSVMSQAPAAPDPAQSNANDSMTGLDVDSIDARDPAPGRPEDEPEEQREKSRALNEQQTEKALKVLKRLGVDPDQVPTFNSVEDVQRAIDNGVLQEGDLYEVNGEIEVVEGA